ncbi:MAG: hypothetical protein KTR18_04705, partial [Acidiferrobacterales bacterium]|nr:hypothetical protein [Acidiferrobacterales bacterium]
MEKSVQNKREGILGAIKAVTNKPGADSLSNPNKLDVAQATKLGRVTQKKTSKIVQEIEHTRASSESAGNPQQFVKEANLLSAPAEKEKTNRETKRSNPKSEESIKSDKPLVSVSTSDSSSENVPTSFRSCTEENPGKATFGTHMTQTSKVAKQTEDSVLPAARPASVSREVDAVLDALELGPKSQKYLVEKVRNLVLKNILETKEQDICAPDIAIVGPVFNAMSYISHKPQIVSLYANLIST